MRVGVMGLALDLSAHGAPKTLGKQGLVVSASVITSVPSYYRPTVAKAKLHPINELSASLGGTSQMEWVLGLTAISMDDSETLLRIVPAVLARNGSWILLRMMSPEGVVHVRFEFEREACVDIYAALVAAGLDLDRVSHSQMTQLCHCSTSLDRGCSGSGEARRSFEPVHVDLEVVPEQAGVFELKPERGSSGFAHRSHT